MMDDPNKQAPADDLVQDQMEQGDGTGDRKKLQGFGPQTAVPDHGGDGTGDR